MDDQYLLKFRIFSQIGTLIWDELVEFDPNVFNSAKDMWIPIFKKWLIPYGGEFLSSETGFITIKFNNLEDITAFKFKYC